jgi:spore germination protein GerM
MSRRPLIAVGIALVAFVVGWLMFVGAPRWISRAPKPVAVAAAPVPAAPPGRKIKARLFYVSEDGTRLTSVERDIAYGEGPIEQAREIISAQIAPVAEPLVSAVPPGTTLRALFVTEGGDAFVDLSRDVTTAHTGGTLDEILTVYTIVNALTTNLPAVTAVQVLVDGKEVDTLSGHIDLRRPLAKNLEWVQ